MKETQFATRVIFQFIKPGILAITKEGLGDPISSGWTLNASGRDEEQYHRFFRLLEQYNITVDDERNLLLGGIIERLDLPSEGVDGASYEADDQP